MNWSSHVQGEYNVYVLQEDDPNGYCSQFKGEMPTETP